MKIELKKPAKKSVKKTAVKKAASKKVQDSRIYFVLDGSGSMQVIKMEALDGFNTFVEEQKKIKGKSKISLITFNNRINTVFKDVDLKEVKPLLASEYVTAGMTSLYDTIGNLLTEITSTQRPKKEKVIIAILTDGEDTSSQHHTYHTIQPLMKSAQDELGYEILFVGTNINAKSVAGNMGIKLQNTTNFDYTSKGATDVMRTVSVATSAYRGVSQNVAGAVYSANNFALGDLYEQVKKLDPKSDQTDPTA